MQERQRVFAAIRGERGSKHAWMGDLSYWYDSLIARGRLPEEYAGDDGYLRMHRELGVGICFYTPFLWKTEYTGGVEYTESKTGGTLVKKFVTPVGALTSVERYITESYCWAITEHFIKDEDDLKTYMYITEHSRFTPDYDGFVKLDRLWGDDGVPVAMTPLGGCPLQRLLARLAGVENTYGIYADDPDAFDDFIETVAEAELPVFKIIADSPAQLIEYPENLSADITGRSFFEKYDMPFYKSRNALLHAAGKYTSIHNDGILMPCFSMLSDCGFDVIEAVTPYPVGDLAVSELREKAGEKPVIWGGIPGAMFSKSTADAEFERYMAELIAAVREDEKFVFGIADQFPTDGVVERLKRVRELVDTL